MIAQGAESVLYKDDGHLIKHRLKKSYRIKELDDYLRRTRTRSEARMIKRSSKLVNVPKLLIVDEANNKLVLEFIEGDVLRDVISDLDSKELLKVCKQVGESIAKLHNSSIIHGDLTTSNMILKQGIVYFIDFGLSEVNKKIEAKAVDLHVLKEALKSKHYDLFNKVWKLIINYYKKFFAESKLIVERLKVVESRGRYKKICS